MMSTKSFLKHNLKTLPIVLVIFTIFSVSLTENLQIADGFLSYAKNMEFNMQVGETQMDTWNISNDNQEPLYLIMFAKGPGSDLFVFEDSIIIQPGELKEIEIFVVVPEDHPDNLKYFTEVYAQKIRPPSEDTGAAQININIQHRIKPVISIGDNPIEVVPVYNTPSEDDEEVETPTSIINEEIAKVVPGETMEEKLARINAANQAKAPQELIVDDVWEETFEESYEEEPVSDNEPIVCGPGMEEVNGFCQASKTEEPVGCDFIAMILSWFGFGKC